MNLLLTILVSALVTLAVLGLTALDTPSSPLTIRLAARLRRRRLVLLYNRNEEWLTWVSGENREGLPFAYIYPGADIGYVTLRPGGRVEGSYVTHWQFAEEKSPPAST